MKRILHKLARSLALSTGHKWYVIRFEFGGKQFEIVRDHVPDWLPENNRITVYKQKRCASGRFVVY